MRSTTTKSASQIYIMQELSTHPDGDDGMPTANQQACGFGGPTERGGADQGLKFVSREHFPTQQTASPQFGLLCRLHNQHMTKTTLTSRQSGIPRMKRMVTRYQKTAPVSYTYATHALEQ